LQRWEDDGQSRNHWQNIYLTKGFVSFQTKLMFINKSLMIPVHLPEMVLSRNRRENRVATGYSGTALE
jgi:hypothetical protein